MNTFLTIAIIHFLAVASPGPDFAIVVKNGITQSRSSVLWTAFGVSLGILIHVGYSILGIGFIIAQSIVLFTIIKLIGAGYLLFIGWHSLTAKKGTTLADAFSDSENKCSAWQSIRQGFLCNALNPKATLFFLALFTQVIEPSTPLLVQLGFGIYMSFQTFVWFAFLGSALSLPIIRKQISTFHHWVERVMGAVLITLGIRVALAVRE
ncbi:LysE family transporter [Candidatus Peregrinibacteria bacterium]|jgi:RhtB (resistance to homoserine/threonine) family protein|nr:LysE family transporter [Candidatus Peregrinibacteria bacterium]MBT3599023.1 LysE family transporter [Candidatus Peregrinibacteria bacterium]MBT4366825.1 LysE family transporter [Candidatus Peregrinibacteria bacterium]MBT4585920.1 LysE family transporter [Candidatus Peregrinibacteria bacterium]MBT6730671.1 LysE family transporter [Candidatus Peregrinibacteria bacterium]